jgi:hypothetical protein
MRAAEADRGLNNRNELMTKAAKKRTPVLLRYDMIMRLFAAI